MTIRSSTFEWAAWTLLVPLQGYSTNDKGSSINDVSSKGEGGGVENAGIYLVKRRQKGREGGHKIGNGLMSFVDGP